MEVEGFGGLTFNAGLTDPAGDPAYIVVESGATKIVVLIAAMVSDMGDVGDAYLMRSPLSPSSFLSPLDCCGLLVLSMAISPS